MYSGVGPPPNLVGPATNPAGSGPDSKQTATGTAGSPSSSSSSSSPTMELRNDKVSSAVRFLKHPNVRTSSPRARMIFLEKKGLTTSEIAEALRQVDPSSNEYTLVVAGAAEGILASDAVAGKAEEFAGDVGMGVSGGESQATRARLNQLTAQLSQLAEAQESASSWWRMVIPGSLLIALGAGLGYFLHNYVPRVTITIGASKDAADTENSAKADAPSAENEKEKNDAKGYKRKGKTRKIDSGYESDLSEDYDSEEDDELVRSRWRKLQEAGGGSSRETQPPNGPTKEDFQRLKSEIDHIADEIAISSKANTNVLEEIRDALLAIKSDSKSLSAQNGAVDRSAPSIEAATKIAEESLKSALPPIESLEEAIIRMRKSATGNAKLAVSYLKFFLKKTLSNPQAGTLNKQNQTVRKILEVEGGSEFLRLAGFEQNEHAFEYKAAEDEKEREEKLQNQLKLLDNFDVIEVNSGMSPYADQSNPPMANGPFGNAQEEPEESKEGKEPPAAEPAESDSQQHEQDAE